jgi:Predicted DNA alkylation repair enzyme
MNTTINQRLHEQAESDYKVFNERIIPTHYEILGIRMPALKKLAKELAQDPDVNIYLDNAEFTTYEHVLLYGLTLGQVKHLSVEELFAYLDPLILKFDNWAHVDTLVSAFGLLKKHREAVLEHYLPMKTHEGEFTKRFFVILLMDYFMDEESIDSTLQHWQEVPQGQYYVDMAIAWAISVGLVKHYDNTLAVLKQQSFSKFVHNKAIQKARESCRISPDTKDFLNRMKIK